MMETEDYVLRSARSISKYCHNRHHVCDGCMFDLRKDKDSRTNGCMFYIPPAWWTDSLDYVLYKLMKVVEDD